jgi:hypothetical protein
MTTVIKNGATVTADLTYKADRLINAAMEALGNAV